jgi:hypothetical protein
MVRKGIFVAHAWWPANLFADGFGWYHQVRLLKSCHNLIQRLSASILLQKGPPVLHYRGMKDTMDILFVKKYIILCLEQVKLLSLIKLIKNNIDIYILK